MRSTIFVAGLVATTNGLSIGRRAAEELYALEIAPGVTKVVTEAEKWALKLDGVNFFDITASPEPAEAPALARRAVSYPTRMAQTAAVDALLPKLDKALMRSNLQTFSNFHNRYYRADYGRQSSEWLLAQVKAVISASGATANVTASAYRHSFVQSSVVATIPGKGPKLVVVGAHQDSVNGRSPTTGRAPGADDNGSGSVGILDAFRVLLSDPKVAAGQAANTIEFHWYAGEEGGLLGSQDIFTAYSRQKREVVGMMNQDLTGYTQGTVNAGKKPVVGIMTDYTDAPLNAFVKLVVTEYCAISYVETKCGYACSDHASAGRAGYPATLATESAFEHVSKLIHTADDTMATVDFDQVLEFAKLATGFAYELGFATV